MNGQMSQTSRLGWFYVFFHEPPLSCSSACCVLRGGIFNKTKVLPSSGGNDLTCACFPLGFLGTATGTRTQPQNYKATVRRGFVCGWVYFWIAFAINFEFSLLKPLLLSAAIWKKKTKKQGSHSWLFWGLVVALPKSYLVESSLVYCGNNLDNLDLSWKFPLSVMVWGCKGGRSRHRWILLKSWQGFVAENELD